MFEIGVVYKNIERAEPGVAEELGAFGSATVHEAMVARHMGMDVLGLSCITNMAAGVTTGVLDHAQVLAAGARAEAQVSAVLAEIVRTV